MYFEWDEKKNQKLKEERGIDFEDVVIAIEEGRILDILEHPNQQKYANQLLIIVEIDNYAYVVPCRVEKDCIRLITVFPSRKMTKKYLGGRK